MFLARKISRAKWTNDRGLAQGEISADAVTGDLRTQGNKLSFWRCNTDTNRDVEDAALAIAAAGERVDRLDIVWVPGDQLVSDGQTLIDSRGRTPVSEMVDQHVDVCRLDYVRLGSLARCVVSAIENRRCQRLTKGRIKKLLSTAVKQGRIELDDLADALRTEIVG